MKTGIGPGRIRAARERGGKAFGVLAAVLFAALSAFPAAATAGVLFERHYSESARKAGKLTEGNYVEGFAPKRSAGPEKGRTKADDPFDYRVSPGAQINPASGTMVIRVKYNTRRTVTPDWIDVGETLFALMDSRGKYIFTATVIWGDAVPPWFAGAGKGGLEISSDIMPPTVWGSYLPFDRRIEVGEWATFAFTWDNGVNRVYLNGQELKEKYGAGWETDNRIDNHGPFGDYLKNASVLRIGADNEANNIPLVSGVVSGFEIHDQAMAFAASRPTIGSVSDDTFKVPGISGKLVAGDTVTAALKAPPGGRASFDLGRVKGIPMTELPAAPAVPGAAATDNASYRGSYTIRPGDDFENGQVLGNFVSADNVAADPVPSASKWTIDTKPRVSFQMDKRDLPADSAAKTRIKLAAKDANGNPVKGRHLKLTLATTDEYTGTVGAGDFGKDVGASVETRWKGETDSWGEVEFDYTAGFAAKTVILSAKDLDSGGVTVDYITAFKEASIDIALTQPVNRAAMRRSMQYVLKVEASRAELTADGRSRSVIRATLLDPNGTKVAGDPVTFSLSSPNGTLRTIEGTTNASGVATAEYTAGKKIGIVVVTATASLRNVSGNVSIILLSDAPAKIHLKARPDTLPADGVSRADISVKVTDVNDNPNKDTKVEFRLAKGAGKLEYPDRLTDRFGDAANRFTAGTVPGIATVSATVRSKVPTEAELARARNILFVPYSPEGDEIRVERWLKKKGDTAVAGEPVLAYTVGRSRETRMMGAPFDLTLEEILVEYWNNAEVGQTLATVVPKPR